MERAEAGGERVEFVVQQDQSVGGGWLTVGEGLTLSTRILAHLHPGYIWS